MHFTLSLFTTALVGFTSVLAAPAPILTSCSLTGVAPNAAWFIDTTNSSNVIPGPSASQKLARMVVGVGSQNYSCVAGKPTPNGAVAVLYDISCASSSEDWADVITRGLLQAPANAQSQGVRILQTILNAQLTVGYHFFKGDFATPAFEFLDKKKFYGGVAGKVPAMAGADDGKQPLNYGAVPTLRLNSKPGMGSDYSSIFRVQTAGGQAPANCDWTGQKQIPYAAQYWVYI